MVLSFDLDRNGEMGLETRNEEEFDTELHIDAILLLILQLSLSP